VGVISVAPLSGLLRTVPFAVEGEARSERDMDNVNLRVVSPGYLATVGTQLLKGRFFSEQDRSETPSVALVSSALAEKFLNHAPLGRRLLINDNTSGLRPIEVVGVVENVHQAALDTPPSFDVYIPLRQVHSEAIGLLRNNQFWMIKTATPPGSFRAPFASSLRAVDPDAAISSSGIMRDYVDASMGPRRFNLGFFGAFSLTGVLLAVLGLYALVSYTVSQRQREISLRIAIGATEREIQGMILRQAAVLGLAGVAIGGCLAAMVQPFVSRLAQDVSISARSAIITSLALLVLEIMATWLPARRASRIPPTLAIRAE
jgi:ABC-type antimicrobial peptide transport system permease subunit